MRIVSGKFRGTKLETLLGENTRPTLDRVRESLFNIIQMEIKDSIFLDMFSGSGACGLEAISRGAKKAILCDSSKEAIRVIRKNVAKTRAEDKTEIYQMPFETLLRTKIKENLDIVFIDPPYKTDYAYQGVKLLIEQKLVNEESIIIIETDEEEKVKEKIQKLDIEITDTRKYGRAHLIFLKVKDKN